MRRTARGAADPAAADRSLCVGLPTDPAFSADVPPSVRTNTQGGWHLAFWLITALVSCWVLIDSNLSATRKELALGLLGLLAVVYLATVHRATLMTGRRAAVYLPVALVVTSLSCAIDPDLSMLLFLTYSQGWFFTRNTVRGASFAVLLTIGSCLGILSDVGWSPDQLRQTIPKMLVSLLFAVLLGVWISRMAHQSEERAELIRELQATRSDLAATEHTRGVLAERERMAREIHDTLAQGFTSVVMLSQTAGAILPRRPEQVGPILGQIEAVARENLAEARALVAAFAPVGLHDSTLTHALLRLVERFGAETGLDLQVQVDGEMSGLRREAEVVLLRATQEALTNVRRHAQARSVVVRFVADDQGARVEIGDDGVGFAPADARAGFGLDGIRSRVVEVGGEMDVASTPGGGTRICVRVPTTRDPVTEEEQG